MFVHKLSGITNAAVGAYSYSDVIDLTNKRYDGKRLAFKLDLTSLTTTGTLNAISVVAERSGGTYTTFTNVSGTTILLSGATTSGGGAGNGSYYVPLTIQAGAGVTRWLESVPYIKFGFNAVNFNVPFDAWLLVG